MKVKFTLFFLLMFTAFGLYQLITFSAAPGELVNVQGEWPSSSSLLRSQKDHLVMFVHPGCSCSMASLSELSRLMTKAPQVTAQVVFMKKPELDNLYEKNSLLEKAKLLPRTSVVIDLNGKETELFEAKTSGTTYLYNPEGQLVFTGGLTMARGHEGVSEGQNVILSYLKNKQAGKWSSLVFGCDLFNQTSSITMVK